MGTTYEDLFHVMNQFRKLKFNDLFPQISRMDFFTMSMIMDKGKEGQMTISELAAKAGVLPPAVSRTLRGLEEKGYIDSGKITRDSQVRVVRDGIVIAEDEIASLKRFKDDAKEVAEGYECGVTLEKFADVKEGDVYEAFKMEEYRD